MYDTVSINMTSSNLIHTTAEGERDMCVTGIGRRGRGGGGGGGETCRRMCLPGRRTLGHSLWTEWSPRQQSHIVADQETAGLPTHTHAHVTACKSYAVSMYIPF